MWAPWSEGAAVGRFAPLVVRARWRQSSSIVSITSWASSATRDRSAFFEQCGELGGAECGEELSREAPGSPCTVPLDVARSRRRGDRGPSRRHEADRRRRALGRCGRGLARLRAMHRRGGRRGIVVTHECQRVARPSELRVVGCQLARAMRRCPRRRAVRTVERLLEQRERLGGLGRCATRSPARSRRWRRCSAARTLSAWSTISLMRAM